MTTILHDTKMATRILTNVAKLAETVFIHQMVGDKVEIRFVDSAHVMMGRITIPAEMKCGIVEVRAAALAKALGVEPVRIVFQTDRVEIFRAFGKVEVKVEPYSSCDPKIPLIQPDAMVTFRAGTIQRVAHSKSEYVTIEAIDDTASISSMTEDGMMSKEYTWMTEGGPARAKYPSDYFRAATSLVPTDYKIIEIKDDYPCLIKDTGGEIGVTILLAPRISMED